MMNVLGATNPNEFERLVCRILYRTEPYKLSHYDGGADRGRDIVIYYKEDEMLYEIIVECKFYTRGVNKEEIMPALNWAKVHRPALLYFWIVPYLTPATKDYIDAFSNEYSISVQYEESVNINEYNNNIDDKDTEMFLKLKERILDSAKKYYSGITSVEFDYAAQVISTEHFLVDRIIEQEALVSESSNSFFIQGVSSSGKTQLVKYVVKILAKNGHKVFWHTVVDDVADNQNSSFFSSLSMFLWQKTGDKRLYSHFKEYGYCLTDNLALLLKQTFYMDKIIMVIDDAHLCADNQNLKHFFEFVIKNNICRTYFIGWFNNFYGSVDVEKRLTNIILDGLDEDYLSQIIFHNTGSSMKNIAKIIQDRYDGLPGYANLVTSENTFEDYESELSYLHSFLKFLSESETIALYVLTLTSEYIPAVLFAKHNLVDELIALKGKRIVESRAGHYGLHDTYRKLIKKTHMNEAVLMKVLGILISFIDFSERITFDVVEIYITQRRYEEACLLLDDRFNNLLQNNLEQPTLTFINRLLESDLDASLDEAMLSKKVILFERLNLYALCLEHLNLLERGIFSSGIYEEQFLYIRLRCYYFQDMFDELLALFFEKQQFIVTCSAVIYIQIMLLVGRVLYIRGNLESALLLYLAAFLNAVKVHEKPLIIKAIHRIAMIEACKGLIRESLNTFENLLQFDKYNTGKRKSYIYHRIAKSYYKLGNMDMAKYFCTESIKLKESYGIERGLVFSHRLLAKIALKSNEFPNALLHSEKAISHAVNLKIGKEELSARLTKAKILMSIGDNTNSAEVRCLLKISLSMAESYKMPDRVSTIMELSKDIDEELYALARCAYQNIKKEAKEDILALSISTLIENNYEDLFVQLSAQNTAITSKLFGIAGLSLIDKSNS